MRSRGNRREVEGRTEVKIGMLCEGRKVGESGEERERKWRYGRHVEGMR